MSAAESIFLDFKLPNATTWFYFSLLLAIALFFKFSRFFSLRNWDLVSLFLLVPGLLILQHGHSIPLDLQGKPTPEALRIIWFGYLWLIVGSVYFMVRCFLDLAIKRRPALGPNLNFGGLAWLGGALLVSLVSVAIRHQEGTPLKVGKGSAVLEQAQKQIEVLGDKLKDAGEVPGFDTDFWVGCGLAILCHLTVVVGLVVVGRRHFQDAESGMAAATFYLLLPYTAFHVGQWHHVAPVALLIWVVAAYRKPFLAGSLLGLASGTVFFPALVFPIWFSFYWRRGAGRFASAFLLAAGISLAVTGSFLWFQGDLSHKVRSALALSDWQPWKQPETEGFWKWIHGTGIHWGYRIPVFVAYVAFILTTVIWPSPKNLAHVLALSAAALIGVQFWYADQGGVYILWYLPLLLLLVFRPNLSDRRPPLIIPENDWVVGLRQALSRVTVWLLRVPEPLAKVR